MSQITCLYCHRYREKTIMPPLCEKHLDLILLINYLGRNGRPVNAANIINLLASGLPLSITADEVSGLLASYHRVELARPFARP